MKNYYLIFLVFFNNSRYRKNAWSVLLSDDVQNDSKSVVIVVWAHILKTTFLTLIKLDVQI